MYYPTEFDLLRNDKQQRLRHTLDSEIFNAWWDFGGTFEEFAKVYRWVPIGRLRKLNKMWAEENKCKRLVEEKKHNRKDDWSALANVL